MPDPHPVPPIEILPPLALAPFVLVAGHRPHWAYMGMWAAFVPALDLKLLHSVSGQVHSIARSAPRRAAVNGPHDPDGHWARAFAKPVTRRVAENWVMLDRLHRAGLGPEPFALAIAPRYRAWFSPRSTTTAGYRLANLHLYSPKLPTTEEEVRAAGVIPDAKRACLREQINGYVSDLNAVRGAMPDNAEDEVTLIADALDAALAEARAGA